ncbi:MAG TPA: hypothetical protein VK138_06455, partial [Acidiferrobacterales bacterium]|nr:hypothetical protein [Acidiferrobacterales bacterium]
MAQTSILARIRARLAARPDTEHEQAVVRLFVGTALFLYLPLLAFKGNEVSGEANLVFFAAMGLVGYLAMAAAVFGWIYFLPAVSPTRRIVASILDTGGATFFMYHLGEYGTPLYIFYIWTIFGNGFRYGKPYLYNSLALS